MGQQGARHTSSSGWAALDERLGGGWPVGALVEVRGAGRTSLALGAVRVAQSSQQPVAWVDGPRHLCPSTSRVSLQRFTWVRPRGRALFAADVLLRSQAFALLVCDPSERSAPLSTWFRLAGLARRARSVLLVLHDRSADPCGSAAAIVVDVSLRPVLTRPWNECGSCELDVCVQRHRYASRAKCVRIPG